MAGLALPDDGNRHVLAVEARAGAIVTFNLRHSPADTPAPCALTARDPGSLLCGLHDTDPKAIVAGVDAARLELSRIVPSEDTCIEPLHKQRLTAFAARLRRAPG